MAKKSRIEVAEYINGEYVFPSDLKRSGHLAGISAATTMLIVPFHASASNDTFVKIYDASMKVIDAGIVFVIIFAGVAWVLGNRGKSFEILLGAVAGYLIIRNAVSLRDFVKSLAPVTGGI